jgi:hypothetical protein
MVTVDSDKVVCGGIHAMTVAVLFICQLLITIATNIGSGLGIKLRRILQNVNKRAILEQKGMFLLITLFVGNDYFVKQKL